MTRDDVKKLLAFMTTSFPNYKIENAQQTIDTWQMLLAEYNANDIFLAFKSYCKTSGSGFAPSVPQLIEELEKPRRLSTLSDSEAWSLVRKAISRSAYHSQEEFDKLPPNVRKAVGSAEVLHLWAIDNDFNNEVVMSVFSRNYKSALKREEEFLRLPEEMKVKALAENNTLVLNMGNLDDK